MRLTIAERRPQAMTSLRESVQRYYKGPGTSPLPGSGTCVHASVQGHIPETIASSNQVNDAVSVNFCRFGTTCNKSSRNPVRAIRLLGSDGHVTRVRGQLDMRVTD